MLPGGARFVSVSDDGTVKLWTLDGDLERTFEAASSLSASRRCPTACTLWLAINDGAVRLYHVDGTIVHTFKGHVCQHGVLAGGDARRPAHHQRLG